MITDQQIEAAEQQRKRGEVEEKSRACVQNMNTETMDKLKWLDERDRLDRLSRELRLL